MGNSIIADTGFRLALANSKDRHRSHARIALKELQPALITTWPVMTETCHFLLKRVGNHAQIAFIESYREGAFVAFSLGPRHAIRLAGLMRQYAALPMDLADASLVVLAESIGHGRILTTDKRDFNAYRWKERQPFENFLSRFG